MKGRRGASCTTCRRSSGRRCRAAVPARVLRQLAPADLYPTRLATRLRVVGDAARDRFEGSSARQSWLAWRRRNCWWAPAAPTGVVAAPFTLCLNLAERLPRVQSAAISPVSRRDARTAASGRAVCAWQAARSVNCSRNWRWRYSPQCKHKSPPDKHHQEIRRMHNFPCTLWRNRPPAQAPAPGPHSQGQEKRGRRIWSFLVDMTFSNGAFPTLLRSPLHGRPLTPLPEASVNDSAANRLAETTPGDGASTTSSPGSALA
jgi:hypothetical protein